MNYIMNKKIKSIGGLLALTAILLANLHILSSDKAMERLLLLQSVESLAEEELEMDRYKELCSFLCSDGSYYLKCTEVFDEDKYCLPSQETYCPVGTEKDTTVTVPGNTAIIQSGCSSLGHNWLISGIVKQCGRCGLTIKL